MPWKFTKLVYCGVGVRRRTLYVIALVTTIATVPTMAWALLTWSAEDLMQAQRMSFVIAAAVSGLLAANAWRLILRHNVTLYWEEARFIWPVAMLLLIFAVWLAMFIGESLPPPYWTSHPDELPLWLACALASPLLLLILWRWIRLPQTERRYAYDEDANGADAAATGKPPSKQTPSPLPPQPIQPPGPPTPPPAH